MKGIAQPVEVFEVGERRERRFFAPPPAQRRRCTGSSSATDDLWTPTAGLAPQPPRPRATPSSGAPRISQALRATSRGRRAARHGARPRRHREDPARAPLRPARWLGSTTPGGVWFLDLAEARSLGGILLAVALALKRATARAAASSKAVQVGPRHRRARPVPRRPRQLRADRRARVRGYTSGAGWTGRGEAPSW